jgi:predicted AAA+ superfamily ATPase
VNTKIRSLSKSDVVVFCGGANDEGRNNSSKAIHQIMNFVINSRHTNVIIITASHRYELVQSSCVNSEISSFNRKLKKIVKLHHQASILEIVNERNRFTNHGLHLNSQGKEMLSNLIVSHTYSILEQKTDSPIILNFTNFMSQSTLYKVSNPIHMAQ